MNSIRTRGSGANDPNRYRAQVRRIPGLLVMYPIFAILVGLLVLVAGSERSQAQGPALTWPPVRVAFIGDSGFNKDAKKVLELIKKQGADFVLHQGDFAYSNEDAAAARDWNDQVNKVLGADYPYFGAVGNHDNSAWSTYQGLFQDRLNRNPDAVCQQGNGGYGVNTACHYKGIFFILSGVGTRGSGHVEFIRDQLARDNSTWSICSWHKTQRAMQVGTKGDEVGWGAYEACREGGAIIATGHEHSYVRTRTLTNFERQVVDPDRPDRNNVRVIPGSTFAFVSALGGHSERAQERCRPTTYPYGCNGEWANIYTTDQKAKPGALFIDFNVDGDPNQARGRFIDVKGKIIDEFMITANGVSVDDTPPVITLLGSDPVAVGVGSGYTDAGAAALDDQDGDISSSVVVDASQVNTALIGTYSVTYDVTDSAGNPALQVTRTVNVVAQGGPVPVGFWSFDEGAGTTASDASGNGHTGTLANGTTWLVPGHLGNAVKFDGSDDQVRVTDSPDLNFGALDDFSISFWFQDSTLGPNSKNASEILEKQDASVLYQVRSPNSNGDLRVQIKDGSGAAEFFTTAGNLADGQWHHVVFLRDHNVGISAFVDGNLAGSTYTVLGDLANGGDLLFGEGNTGPYDGALDQVRIYRQVLSPAEIGQIFAEGSVDTEPLADAGEDQEVKVGDMVTLDGSGSTGAETYSWTLTMVPTNSMASLAGADSASPSFVTDLAGRYEAELVVGGGTVTSPPATVGITVSPKIVGLGLKLSRNSDFLTTDTNFNYGETVYILAWSDQLDFNNIKKSQWELEHMKGTLTNNQDMTYTGQVVNDENAKDVKEGKSSTGKVEIEVEDQSGRKFKTSQSVILNGPGG